MIIQLLPHSHVLTAFTVFPAFAALAAVAVFVVLPALAFPAGHAVLIAFCALPALQFSSLTLGNRTRFSLAIAILSTDSRHHDLPTNVRCDAKYTPRLSLFVTDRWLVLQWQGYTVVVMGSSTSVVHLLGKTGSEYL